MENEVVDEEIDLRNYLRVIWKNRMLILGFVLVSLITSGFYSFFVLHDEYQTEARLSYKPDPKIPLADAIEIIKSQPIIQKTIAQNGEVSNNEALTTLSSLKAGNVGNTNQILLQLRGNNPETVKKYLGTYINVSVEELNRISKEKLSEELNIRSKEKLSLEKSQSNYSRLENFSVLYTKQREEVYTELKKKLVEEADLEINRMRNLSLIAKKIGSKDKQLEIEYNIVDLISIKEGGRVYTNFSQQLIRSNPELTRLNTRLNSLDAKLTELQVKMIEQENSDSGVDINSSVDISSKVDATSNIVELLTPPTNPAVISPKRTLNIAIASVFGLFLGVFVVVFKNYIEGSISK